MNENNNPQESTGGKNKTQFSHLHTHSHYSLLDGLAKIDDLVSRAKELGMESLALTDHGNLYGAIEFYKKAKAAGIKPILGLEAYIAPGNCRDKNSQLSDKYYHLILLCKNNIGWKNLIKLVTAAHLEGFYYKPRMDKNLLRQHSDGLIALSGCLSGEIARLLLKQKFEEARTTALEYQEIFGKGNFFLEIGHHPAIKETEKIKENLIRLSKETGIPLAATQDIHYLKPEDSEYHDILLAVQTGNKVGDADRLTLKEDDFSMRSPEQMAEIFKDLPEAIENAVKISEQCEVKLELGKTLLPKFSLPNGENSNSYLRKLVEEKIRGRYGNLTRTHLNNISARDMSQFPQDQEATTKVCLLHTEEESTQVLRKLAISRAGCGDFLVPPRCSCVAAASAAASLPRLADTRKSLATRAGDIIEMGSSISKLFG